MKRTIRAFLVWLYSFVARDKSPKVLYYHDIGTKYTPMGTPLELFMAHMSYLATQKPNAVRHIIAFDDGFRGLWDHREKLAHFHICPKVFIAPRLVGLPDYLTWDEIRVLQNEYGLEFQCHTWSHQSLVGPLIKASPLRIESDQWYDQELIESKKEIERHIGRSVTELCFPAGYYSEKIVARCRNAGYVSVYSSDPIGSKDGYVKPRCFVQDASIFSFRAILRGGLGIFSSRYRKKHLIK